MYLELHSKGETVRAIQVYTRDPTQPVFYFAGEVRAVFQAEGANLCNLCWLST